MGLKKYLLLTSLLIVIVCCYQFGPVKCQRNLLHWKHELEHRLNSYRGQREAIRNILDTSIHTNPSREYINGQASVSSHGNVRFSDLIIPTGKLVIDSHSSLPAVRIMSNKAENYINTKMGEFDQAKVQLDTIQAQLNDTRRQYIYKGLPNEFKPQVNNSLIRGTWIFKQFTYGQIIECRQVNLRQINFTNVDHVLNETYMDSPKYGLLEDSKSRLFFEGKKTFWNTVFEKPLKSGCCDRLRPLHTNRMMTYSTNQEIFAPVMFHTNDYYNKEPVVIGNLHADHICNRILAVGLLSNRPSDETGLVPSLRENLIQDYNLINIRNPMQHEIFKTLIFKDGLSVDEANIVGPTAIITFESGHKPFDLWHDNYLLRYPISSHNATLQRVAGTLIINGETTFTRGIDAYTVNQVQNFNQFATQNIVRLDRPAQIRGSVRMNALPSVFSQKRISATTSRDPQSVTIMFVNGSLDVQLLNGMRLPYDIVRLPLRPHEWIHVRGARLFENLVTFEGVLDVNGLVSGHQMPDGVIPLHLNDFMGSVGHSNLVFLDGITAQHVTVQSGRFDELTLRDVYGDAQSLIMNSMVSFQPDGSQLIRAPLRVKNLHLLGQQPNQGLLNGFRPQDLVELAAARGGRPLDQIYGPKTFLGHVEAADCVISDINNVVNWTHQLIRIDRPNTVQTIHTKLAFETPPIPTQVNNYAGADYSDPSSSSSSVTVERLSIDFYPNTEPINYLSNLHRSAELYVLYQALLRGSTNKTGSGRYRVLDQVRIFGAPYGGPGNVNNISLDDIITLDTPFRFADRFVMVGKVEVAGDLSAGLITSTYPIDAMDLEQFDNYRIPTIGSAGRSTLPGSLPSIKLNNLVLAAENNQATFVRAPVVNEILFNQFVSSIMSLTKPQVVDGDLIFNGPVNLEGLVRCESSLNGLKNFRQFARKLKTAKYSFEDGLQCNSVSIRV